MQNEECTISIQQFCEIEGLTLEDFQRLQAVGMAPVLLTVVLKDGRYIDRITPAEWREWHLRLMRLEERARGWDFGPVTSRHVACEYRWEHDDPINQHTDATHYDDDEPEKAEEATESERREAPAPAEQQPQI